MKTLARFVAATVLVAGAAAVEPLIVGTPLNATICEPVVLAWFGGAPPYLLTVGQVVDGNFGILDFSAQDISVTSFTWVVNITYGVENQLFVTVIDGAGTFAQSSPFNVLDSADHSCLTASPSAAGSPTVPGTASTESTSSQVSSAAKSNRSAWGKIIGIGLGVLGALLLLGAWRLYILRKKRSRGDFGDSENFGIDRKVGNLTVLPLEMARLGDTKEKVVVSKGEGDDVFDQKPF